MLALILSLLVMSPEQKVLILGDSISDGYGVTTEQAYPHLIQEALRKEGLSIKLMNGAVSGSLSSSGPSRLKWYLKSKPDILILQLGGNDGLKGTPPKAIKENLRQTIQMAKDNEMKVILAGMKMFQNYGASYAREFEQLYVELAKEENVILIPFLLQNVGGHRDLNLPDGIHPNPEGHEIIAKNILKYLRPLL